MSNSTHAQSGLFSRIDPVRQTPGVDNLLKTLERRSNRSRAAGIAILMSVATLIPAGAWVVGNFIGGDVSIDQNTAIILGSLGFGFIMLSLVFIYFLHTQRYMGEQFIELYGAYISVVNDQHPLKNVVGRTRFAFDTVAVLSALTSKEIKSIYTGHKLDDDKEKRFLFSFLNYVKLIFEYFTGAKVAVCIKALEQIDDNHSVIFTLWRDRMAYNDRSSIDKIDALKSYDPWGNTAFRSIVDKDDPKRYFISNDLRSLAGAGKYQNTNPHWANFYNAAAVVPIQNSEGEQHPKIFGFLCVDSLEGRFNEELTIPLLFILADLFYSYVFVKSIVLADEESRRTDNHERSQDA